MANNFIHSQFYYLIGYNPIPYDYNFIIGFMEDNSKYNNLIFWFIIKVGNFSYISNFYSIN
jgi:hypothetical protein